MQRGTIEILADKNTMVIVISVAKLGVLANTLGKMIETRQDMIGQIVRDFLYARVRSRYIPKMIATGAPTMTPIAPSHEICGTETPKGVNTSASRLPKELYGLFARAYTSDRSWKFLFVLSS